MKTVNIHGKDHPVYAGLLDEAHKQGLSQIKTKLIQAPTAENGYMAICWAEVTTSKGTFSGIGDATPKNVNKMIAPHIVRMAETRAKGRALRDALNIGEALAEEMGGTDVDEIDGIASNYQVIEIEKLMDELDNHKAVSEFINQKGYDRVQDLPKDYAQAILDKLRNTKKERNANV